jgi:hypothetical protein
MNRTSVSTTAILCVARNELPFTEEWLEYHFALGFDRVHYVSTDEDFSRVEAFFDLSRFGDRVELHHFTEFEPGWQIRCYNRHLGAVEEDWLMVLDLDEFLVIDPGTTIVDLVDGLDDSVAQVQFPWLLAMSDEYWQAGALDIVDHARGHVSDHVKSLVRREQTHGLGVHAHNVGAATTILSSGQVVSSKPRHRQLLDDPAAITQSPFVLHLSSRGHLDVLTRIIDHQFFNAKNGQSERERLTRYLKGDATWSQLPNRFLMQKFYESLPVTSIPTYLPATTSSTDIDELNRNFLNQICKIIDFDFEGPGDVSARFEERYRLSQKLRSQSLDEQVDLNRYLSGSTQMDYMSELRDLLADR